MTSGAWLQGAYAKVTSFSRRGAPADSGRGRPCDHDEQVPAVADGP